MTADNEPNRRRNVIILWKYLNWGGAQIYFLSIVKHAPPNWKFKIVIPRKSPKDIVELFEKNGAEIVFRDVFLENNPADSLFKKINRQWSRIHAEISTYNFVRKQNLKDTVLHVETAPWQSWIFLKKISEYLNVFVTMHNSMPATSKWRERIWLFRMKYVSRLKRFHCFASNQDTKDSLKPWVTDEFWRRINVTYTSVDPVEIDRVLETKPCEIRRKFSIDENAFVVLCVGQFIDRKGRKDFLQAAKFLADKNENLVFAWLTQTELTSSDYELIESYGLGDSFRVFKSKDVGTERLDILRFFLTADVFALPSYVEGLPIALLEAMALGIPSISTNVNAIPEAISHGETGLLIEPGDSRGLADAIVLLKNNNELRDKLAGEGRKLVTKKFDERECARIVLQSYQSAMDDNL